MSFNNKEISNDQGQRIGLYHFRLGSLNWYYTSADRPIEYGTDEEDNPIVYEPIAISDGGVTQDGEVGFDFQVNLPSDNPVAALYRVTPPSGRMYLKVRRMQLGEADAPVSWVGTVGNIKPKGLAGVLAVCRASISLLKQTGLRLAWTRQCPFALYDRQCKVNPADYTFPYEIASVVGNVVTLKTSGDDKAAGYFTGGIVKWLMAEDTYNQRLIESHDTTLTFTIFGRGDGLEADMEVELLPGCARDISDSGCLKFDNVDNYGGHLYMPGKSPFDGSSVF